jgi:hypothetical protein
MTKDNEDTYDKIYGPKIQEIREAVNKCSPEVPRLLMNYIHKGEYIGTPGLPEKQYNQIEELVYEFRNKCGCRNLHEFE